MNNPFAILGHYATDLATLESELQAGLRHFWEAAAVILNNSTIQLSPPDEKTLSLKRNFFSALFLYSYYRSDIPPQRRILYAALNQCLRGMVTGCDNILDDEYKITLETDLPHQAHRFRSILDIMVADRVLFTLLTEYCYNNGLPPERAVQAANISLQALAMSGAQEAAEEGGISERLTPAAILTEVHHYKTGVLFQSTWAIPSLLEGELSPVAHSARQALYQIGIGCQLLDDLVDLFVDLQQQRHNYVASVILHNQPHQTWDQLQAMLVAGTPQEDFYETQPELFQQIKSEALTTLEGGLRSLFFERHQQAIRPAATFIARRIGVETD